MDNNISTTSFYNDIRRILQSARSKAYTAVNTAMVDVYSANELSKKNNMEKIVPNTDRN